jgi:DNA-binding transcriptional LysR family regulator
MNLSHLYYFRKLVEARSYSAAAEQLYIAQPTLSLAVSNLEKELGAPLLRKKRNGIELTEDGEEFYTAVLTATNALDECVDSIKKRAAAEYGSIRLGVVFSVQSQAWSDMIHEFRHSSGSKIQIELRQGTTESLTRDLKTGELDVIFSGLLGDGDPELVSIPCFTQSAALVVNRDHPLANRRSVSLKELAPYQILTYRNTEGPFVKELGSLLGGQKRLRVRFEFSDEISLCSMVVADPSVVAICCHSWLVDSFPQAVAVEIEEAPRDFHQFYLSYRKRGRASIGVEAFLDLARGYVLDNDSPLLEDEEN